jgi:hypothetical protein
MLWQVCQRQYLYLCTSKASKVGIYLAVAYGRVVHAVGG